MTTHGLKSYFKKKKKKKKWGFFLDIIMDRVAELINQQKHDELFQYCQQLELQVKKKKKKKHKYLKSTLFLFRVWLMLMLTCQ
jgi:hypothetical protein